MMRRLRAGMTPAEARRQAVLALGGVEQTWERVRDAHATSIDSVRRDLAFALRGVLIGVAAGANGSFVLSRAYRSLLVGAASSSADPPGAPSRTRRPTRSSAQARSAPAPCSTPSTQRSLRWPSRRICASCAGTSAG